MTTHHHLPQKAVVPLEVSAAKVHDREILLAELSLLQDRLATRTVPLDDMHDDEESPLLTLPKKSGDDGKRRRASRSHVLGFADSEARRYVKTCRGKDSRIHVRSQRTKTTAEAVLQQQNLTGNATRCVKNYADLLEVTQAAQFGMSPHPFIPLLSPLQEHTSCCTSHPTSWTWLSSPAVLSRRTQRRPNAPLQRCRLQSW